MSKISHLPKNVPSKELPFSIKINGSANKTHEYKGDFVVTVPSVRDMSRIGVEVARLNGGVPFDSLDDGTARLNNSIAFLKVCLKEGPAWFMNSPFNEVEEGMDYGLDTIDINVPIEIYRAANDEVSKWHDALNGQPKAK